MPGQGKYSYYHDTVPPNPYHAPPGAKGAANHTVLAQLFPPPSSGDQITKAGVTATANREVFADTGLPVNPDPLVYTAEDIALGFTNAPDTAQGPYAPGTETAVGGPANPFFPNLASPDPSGGGSTAPVVPTVVDPAFVNQEAVVGINGLVDPGGTNGSSNQMSHATKIGVTLKPGLHPGS